MSISITLMTACGGGSIGPDTTSSQASSVVNPLGQQLATIASDEVASDLNRRARLGVALSTPNPVADQLLNWAEINFPQYFPSHSTTLTEGPWVYRSYMQSGILLGINAGDVYVTGGEFGGQLLKVGKVSDFVKPAIPVKRSSYENKMMAGEMFGRIHLPEAPNRPDEGIHVEPVLGDFFQDGSLSLVAFSHYSFQLESIPRVGGIYFLKWIDGKWVDNTTRILKDQTGCIIARKVLVADFNGDGKPDVFASCHGLEVGPWETWVGEYPRVLLSQPDGTYKNTKFAVRGYYHGSAAADVQGDGYADIVAVDPMVNRDVMYFVNNKDGTFKLDQARLPQSSRHVSDGKGGFWAQTIWTAEWMPLYAPNKYDLVLAGENGPSPYMTWSTHIYRSDSSNRYTDASAVILPDDPEFKGVYDMIAYNGSMYLYRVPIIATGDSMAIQRVSLSTLKSDRIYEHRGYFANGYSTGIWWLIYNNGMIRSYSDEAIVDVLP